jgi:hypothetical protein
MSIDGGNSMLSIKLRAPTRAVLGIARGCGKVQFGGPRGRTFLVKAGDIAILPAGTGHQCLSAASRNCARRRRPLRRGDMACERYVVLAIQYSRSNADTGLGLVGLYFSCLPECMPAGCHYARGAEAGAARLLTAVGVDTKPQGPGGQRSEFTREVATQ